MMSQSNKRKRATVDGLYDRMIVMERAKEVKETLDSKFPILLRVMLPSHVAGGFWLGLPKKFCCEHLPKQDKVIVLEDENGDEFQTRYLVEKVGLSGGWKGFAIAHKLVEGDIVIFHLVTPTKFKVYIVRSNGLNKMDCALGLMKSDACIKQADTVDIIPLERVESESLETIPKDNAINCNAKSGPVSDILSENGSEDLGFEFSDGPRVSESVVTPKEVKCMENFNVLVNGSVINSELSEHILAKYYELCSSQNSVLHEHVLEGLNSKLIAGVISETINIADAIETCKVTTLEGKLSAWDKTLKALEDLGMNVGFLRARLDQLVSLASKSKRLKEALLEKDTGEEEMRRLEEKLLEVKEAISRLDSEIETANLSSEELEFMFQEAATAPW